MCVCIKVESLSF